jgi:S1-C subfamily serine protease
MAPGGWSYQWHSHDRPPQPRRTLPHAVTALLLAVAILVGLGIGHGVWKSVRIAITPTTNSGGSFGQNPSNGGTPSTNVIGQAAAALVDINTSLNYQGAAAAGTGIVLTSDGLILTNNHVITGATTIHAVDVNNGQTYAGTVVGYDRTHDIALVQLQGASDLQTAKLGNSDNVSVGDGVVGLGNAGGVGGTPTSAAGQIVALNQSITASDQGNGTSEQLTGLIETDADIQPGDSGGALINSSGQVIGIDTAASSELGLQSGQGFAIPVNSALSIVNQIRSGQTTSTVHIGPTAFLGVLVSPSSGPGANLENVVNGTPAAQAGLAKGDTITSLGGKRVASPNGLTDLISTYHPGDRVAVEWTDTAGQTHQTTVQLTSGPAQ